MDAAQLASMHAGPHFIMDACMFRLELLALQFRHGLFALLDSTPYDRYLLLLRGKLGTHMAVEIGHFRFQLGGRGLRGGRAPPAFGPCPFVSSSWWWWMDLFRCALGRRASLSYLPHRVPVTQ